MAIRFGQVVLLAAALLLPASPSYGRETVNDVTKLNPIVVAQVQTPRTAKEVAQLVRDHTGPVCIGGARHSQGGQIATEGCLFLDMRSMNRVLKLDLKSRRITVEAGITWRKIQETIDPHDLSLKIMQSYSNFTVGGSLSVNAHGRYVGEGPIVNAVESFVIVLADGSIVEASRTHNRDIFDAAIGGYGGIGVIVSATLDLVPNTKIRRVVDTMSVKNYRSYFFSRIRNSRDAVMHNADIYPPDYRQLSAVTWFKTDESVTVTDRLAPVGTPSRMQRFLMGWLSRGPLGKQIREYLYDPVQYSSGSVEWRNYEASYDASELEPASRDRYTYALQEYFVPTSRFEMFEHKMAKILRASDAGVLNVSIRHANADKETFLSWAPQEMFSFVIYVEEGTKPEEQSAVRKWTAALIAEALSEGGTYYLPYQIVASRAQFLRAYPNAPKFFELKARLDPQCKFRNRLWDSYDDAAACHPKTKPN